MLHDLSRELHSGKGFFVLRTIPVDEYSAEDNILIYAGVSAYVGELRGVQDKDGVVLTHIKDLTLTHGATTIGAPAYTTDKQVYHTDVGDIISLYALQTAEEGGTSRISSSWRIYNELAEKRPDLIKTLAEPWPVERYDGRSFLGRSLIIDGNLGSAVTRPTPCARCYSGRTTKSLCNTAVGHLLDFKACHEMRQFLQSTKLRRRHSTAFISWERSSLSD